MSESSFFGHAAIPRYTLPAEAYPINYNGNGNGNNNGGDLTPTATSPPSNTHELSFLTGSSDPSYLLNKHGLQFPSSYAQQAQGQGQSSHYSQQQQHQSLFSGQFQAPQQYTNADDESSESSGLGLNFSYQPNSSLPSPG